MTPIETYIFSTLFIFAFFIILFLLKAFINLNDKVEKLEKKILKIKQPPFTFEDLHQQGSIGDFTNVVLASMKGGANKQ